jgi:hypothetical protein
MPWLSNEILDGGLDVLDASGTRLDICDTEEPTSYADAVTDGANSLGNKTGLAIPAPSERAPNGREVIVPAITDGVVTETGTALYYAITNGTDTLYATGVLSGGGQAVTDGNVFTLTSFTIGIPDPV